MFNKIRRGFHLFKFRSISWFVTASLGELFFISKPISKIVSILASIDFSFLLPLCGVHTNQLWDERVNAMKLVISKFNEPVTVLEIGSWMGKGSTTLFLNQLPEFSKLVLVDSWTTFVKDDETVWSSKNLNGLSKIALHSAIRTVDNCKKISSTIIRAKSNEALLFLKPNTFDLIYIDGSHYYEEVVADIKNAINLVKNGGIICGDDLDQIPTEENYIIAKSNLEKDLFIFNNGTAIHPGVLAAVKENFTDNVNWDNGFWWLYFNK